MGWFMGSIKELIQSLLNRKDYKQVIQPRTKEGNVDMSGSIYAKTVHQNFYSKDGIDYEGYESISDTNLSIDLKEIIIPIESLINQSKFSLAIQKFEKLIQSSSFIKYSKDEKFLIYNGLLNCHINSNSPDNLVNVWSQKIQALGEEVAEIHRYYFLMGIREYNKHNLKKALIYINHSISKKEDYMNAIAMKVLVNATKNDITYEEAKKVLDDLLKRDGLGVKDYSTIHLSFGYVAFKSKDYVTAQKHYSKSDEFSSSLSKKIGIAVCQYFLSFREVKLDKRIDLDKIDFDSLAEAEKKFKKVYGEKNDDTIQTIVGLGLSYYIHILALMNKHDDILKIYDETKDYFDESMNETLNHIAASQVVNEIFDEDLISKLGEYEQIKYEVFYHEKKRNYDKVIELLTPIFESEYKDEKVLQLSYLLALQEKDDFEKYMYYYQKFSANEDEVMRMNYILFLKKKGNNDDVLSEIKSLKNIAKNGFVLYDLMLIYLEYSLDDELDEFFDKVDSGAYNIIGFQRPIVFFEKMLHLLKIKKYKEYFRIYNETDLSFLKEKHQIILKVNYYVFKNDLDNLASAYYEFFRLTSDHNELIKAVQTKLQINQFYDAEFYLDQVNPMLLDLPENYYIYKAIILKEKNEVKEAFYQLQIVLDKLDVGIDSPFHQFYTAFNMNNNRTDVAFRYMGEYYAKNSAPNWFKVIQYSENDTDNELLKKLEEAVGGKREPSEIDRLFRQGLIGASVYNNIVGNEVEEILYTTRYPFTKVPISRGNIYEAQLKIELIDNKIIVDATTLIILASVDGLELLDVFDELILPYTTLTRLTEKKAGLFNKNAQKALLYLSTSPKTRRLAVDEAMKICSRDNEILTEDTLDCIALTRSLKIPFLNTEVAVNFEHKLNQILDINALLFFLKENYTEYRGYISKVIFNMRQLGLDFINFDAEDMFTCYRENGIEGMKPFLKMGKNADYKTFATTYVNFLSYVYSKKSEDEFKICSREVIHFMDNYIGKTRYYTSLIIRQFPSTENVLIELMRKPSIKTIMFKKAFFEVVPFNEDYLKVVETLEYNKLINIPSGFIVFVFQFISMFGNDPKTKEKYVRFLKECCKINDDEDIEYVLIFMNVVEQKQKDSRKN